MKKRSLLLLGMMALLCYWCPRAKAQVVVSLSPPPKLCFVTAGAGAPLAAGKVFTYSAGTTIPLATYVDSTGTGQNSNPIILGADGCANVWLSQASYKFVVQDSAGIQQWVVDSINGNVVLTAGANTFSGTNVFNGAVTFNGSTTIASVVLALPLSLTASGFTNTLTGLVTAARTWTLQDLSDTFVFRTSTDTLTNKTLTSPVLNTPTANTPSISATPITTSFPNNGVGTGTNLLAKITGNPSTVLTVATTDTSGAVGICASGCGAAGTAQITTIGQATCAFDGATTAGDYVQISATIAGNCKDAGATYPGSGQVIGRVLSTNAAAGSYNVTLFGAEVRPFGGKTIITANPTITFGAIAANSCGEFTVAVTGITTAAAISISPSSGTDTSQNLIWGARPSSAGNVTVRYCNPTVASITPTASQTFNIVAIQ